MLARALAHLCWCVTDRSNWVLPSDLCFPWGSGLKGHSKAGQRIWRAGRLGMKKEIRKERKGNPQSNFRYSIVNCLWSCTSHQKPPANIFLQVATHAPNLAGRLLCTALHSFGPGSSEMPIWYTNGSVNKAVRYEEGAWQRGSGWLFKFGII